MYPTVSSLLTIKPRILLVDEDVEARISYQMLLMDWGYDAVLAMGSGIALLNDAISKAREKSCSLALIDMRLMDNDDEEDISGLALAQELEATHCIASIILSGYESIRVHRLLREHPYIGFIGKQDRRSEIQERLDRMAATVCATKRGVEFTNTEALDKFLQADLVRNMGEHADQLANVLARLFPNAKTLAFERLMGSDNAISSAARPNSIVLKVYEDDMEACIVKLARTAKIQKEANNFRKYIDRKLTANLNLQQIGREEFAWGIGGIAYNYQGEKDVTTFTNYYKEQEIADVQKILSQFFLGTWQKYYKGGRNNPPPVEKSNISLHALYTDMWGQEWYEQRVRKIPRHILGRIEPTLRKYDLPQPVAWLERKLKVGDPEFQPVNTILTAITHGDLHGDNLLVDDKKPIVIDYERTGEGHALQDFIELEADIINRLEAHPGNVSAYLQMCITLFKQDKIQELDESETTSADPQLDKALKTISMIRGFAMQCVPAANVREYLFGLLFNMLFRAALVHKEDPQKSERPLMLAGFICHRLDHWNEPWPPLNGAFRRRPHEHNAP